MERILIVDDSASVIAVLKDQLERCGYEVLTATSGDEAIQKAEQYQPALMLLDVVMPKKDGFQTLRELKTRPATRHLPVIMLSSKGDSSALLQGQELGAMDYVIKESDLQELLKVIQRYLV